MTVMETVQKLLQCNPTAEVKVAIRTADTPSGSSESVTDIYVVRGDVIIEGTEQ